MSEILNLIRKGYRRNEVCILNGWSYKTFKKNLDEHPEFADQVRVVEMARVEACENYLFRLVVEPHDTTVKLRAAIAYLNRHDKCMEARRARREKAHRALAPPKASAKRTKAIVDGQ